MAKEKVVAPTWGYRKGEGGKLEKKIFNLEDNAKLPNGWVDSPAECGHAGKEYGQ